jgi:hypothetical protein
LRLESTINNKEDYNKEDNGFNTESFYNTVAPPSNKEEGRSIVPEVNQQSQS